MPSRCFDCEFCLEGERSDEDVPRGEDRFGEDRLGDDLPGEDLRGDDLFREDFLEEDLLVLSFHFNHYHDLIRVVSLA